MKLRIKPCRIKWVDVSLSFPQHGRTLQGLEPSSSSATMATRRGHGTRLPRGCLEVQILASPRTLTPRDRGVFPAMAFISPS